MRPLARKRRGRYRGRQTAHSVPGHQDHRPIVRVVHDSIIIGFGLEEMRPRSHSARRDRIGIGRPRLENNKGGWGQISSHSPLAAHRPESAVEYQSFLPSGPHSDVVISAVKRQWRTRRRDRNP